MAGVDLRRIAVWRRLAGSLGIDPHGAGNVATVGRLIEFAALQLSRGADDPLDVDRWPSTCDLYRAAAADVQRALRTIPADVADVLDEEQPLEPLFPPAGRRRRWLELAAELDCRLPRLDLNHPRLAIGVAVTLWLVLLCGSALALDQFGFRHANLPWAITFAIIMVVHVSGLLIAAAAAVLLFPATRLPFQRVHELVSHVLQVKESEYRRRLIRRCRTTIRELVIEFVCEEYEASSAAVTEDFELRWSETHEAANVRTPA